VDGAVEAAAAYLRSNRKGKKKRKRKRRPTKGRG
jgi:hypothetical protein